MHTAQGFFFEDASYFRKMLIPRGLGDLKAQVHHWLPLQTAGGAPAATFLLLLSRAAVSPSPPAAPQGQVCAPPGCPGVCGMPLY